MQGALAILLGHVLLVGGDSGIRDGAASPKLVDGYKHWGGD